MAHYFQHYPISPLYFPHALTYSAMEDQVMLVEDYWVASYGNFTRRSREHVQENYRNLNQTLQGLDDEVLVWDESDYIEHLRANLATNVVSRDDRVHNNFSQDTILRHLKRRKFATMEEGGEATNEGPEICVVCQCEYVVDESIGQLRCGHEYHVDCITRWLCQKSVCPICKATAIPTRKEAARV